MLILFALLTGAAHAGDRDLPPLEASAELAPDGAFALRLQAPCAWSAAELVVGGGRAILVGPTQAGDQVEVRGRVEDAVAPLAVVLTVVTAEAAGVTWEFDVDPVAVPAQVPAPVPDPAARRWPWWRKPKVEP